LAEHSTKAHRAMDNVFQQIDPRSAGVMDFIFDVYPLFYKKIFRNNKFMERIVMTGMNAHDILEYYVCGRCETLAPRSGSVVRNGRKVPQCTCTAIGCGATTVDPPTLKTWLLYELRKKAPADMEHVLQMAINDIAKRYMSKAVKDYERYEQIETEQSAAKMGLILPPDVVSKKDAKKNLAPTTSFYEGDLPTDAELDNIVQEDIKEMLNNGVH